MSSSSGSNKEAILLQRESLAEQKRTNAFQLDFLEKQLAALRQTQLAPYRPASPAPTAGTSGADYAAAQERLLASRRFGYNKTVRGGLGGAYAA